MHNYHPSFHLNAISCVADLWNSPHVENIPRQFKGQWSVMKHLSFTSCLFYSLPTHTLNTALFIALTAVLSFDFSNIITSCQPWHEITCKVSMLILGISSIKHVIYSGFIFSNIHCYEQLWIASWIIFSGLAAEVLYLRPD